MKQRVFRLFALLLAAVLLAGALPLQALAADAGSPNPVCKLGADPADMVSGGGLQVRAGYGLFYVNEADGSIYFDADMDDCQPDPEAEEPAGILIYAHPAARLNYWAGKLYFARLRDGVFDLCRLDPFAVEPKEEAKEVREAGEEEEAEETDRAEVLLAGVRGRPGQVYVVNGSTLQFSVEDAILELDLGTGEVHLLRLIPELFSFVPTGCGPVYATGELFDWSLFADGRPIAVHVDQYYVDYSRRGGRLVYTARGVETGLKLAEAFAGDPVPPEEPEPEPEQAVPARDRETAHAGLSLEEAAEAGSAGQEQAAQPEPEAEAEAEGGFRRPLSQGATNVVKRARQMLNVQWTPVKTIKGWGYDDSTYAQYRTFIYYAGQTYTGLPYCQGCNYVPWSTGLSDYVAAVNDSTSKMYTARSTYWRGGPYYGTDCSGFVSWAWDLETRTTSITPYGTLISSPSYTKLQPGDMLSNSHHAMLVTDVLYDSTGAVTTVEISHASPDAAHYGCAYSMVYTGNGLAKVNKLFTGSDRYTLYRHKNLDSVTYTHDCAVPLPGDECPLCGAGMFLHLGADVSEYQQDVDWATAAQSLDFVILRASRGIRQDGAITGVSEDDNLRTNALGCADNGLPYGVYHFAKALTPEDAVKEADGLIEILAANLEEHGTLPDLPVFYDVEEAEMLKLSNEKLGAVVSAFCQTLEDAGFRAGVYASASVWNSKLTDPACSAWVRWVAQWKSETLTAGGGANVWQYSSTGRVAGIPTVVDLDYWLGPVGSEEHRYKVSYTAPTCTEAGCHACTCVDCGVVVTLEEPALGHLFVNGVCTRCGEPESVFDRFLDIAPDLWYSEAVEFVVLNGLFNGVTDTLFAPRDSMNRAMTVTVLYRVAGEPATEPQASFTDVTANAWYAIPVAWAAQNGIAEGTGKGIFSPLENVTRQQLAAFLYRFADSLGLDVSARAELDSFPDSSLVSPYAAEPLSWAVAVGLIEGSEEKDQVLLLPRDKATRAQVAVILHRLCRMLQAQGLWTPKAS